MSNNDFTDSNPFPKKSHAASNTELGNSNPLADSQNDKFPSERFPTEPVGSRGRNTANHLSTDAGTGTEQATEAAKDLAHEGQQSATEVMDAAKHEASMFAEQAKEQATNLLGELGADLNEQASIQQQKVAANLRDISEEFRSMLDHSQASGTASTLVDQASHHSGQIADWLEQREPGDLVDEAKRFARQRPGAFLGIALGAGLLAGRISRNASNKGKKDDSKSPSPNDFHESSSATGSEAVPEGMVAAPSLSSDNAATQDSGLVNPWGQGIVDETSVAGSNQPTSLGTETVEIDPLRSYPPEDPHTDDYK